MKKFIISGVFAIITGLVSLYLTFSVSYANCFKNECNVQAYTAVGIFSFLILIVGLILLLIGVIQLARYNPSKKYWLVIITFAYLAVGFGFFYFVLGGNQYFEARGFMSKFKTTYYTITYVPEGYSESFTTYSAEKDHESVHGPGNYAQTRYRKPLLTSKGQTYHDEFDVVQGDEMNNAAGALRYCGKTFECDVIDGQNVKDIHCQQTNKDACAVKLGGTYISITSVKKLSREEVVKMLDSLTPKKL